MAEMNAPKAMEDQHDKKQAAIKKLYYQQRAEI